MISCWKKFTVFSFFVLTTRIPSWKNYEASIEKTPMDNSDWKNNGDHVQLGSELHRYKQRKPELNRTRNDRGKRGNLMHRVCYQHQTATVAILTKQYLTPSTNAQIENTTEAQRICRCANKRCVADYKSRTQIINTTVLTITNFYINSAILSIFLFSFLLLTAI